MLALLAGHAEMGFGGTPALTGHMDPKQVDVATREDLLALGFGLSLGTALGEATGAGRYVGLLALSGALVVLLWSRWKCR